MARLSSPSLPADSRGVTALARSGCFIQPFASSSRRRCRTARAHRLRGHGSHGRRVRPVLDAVDRERLVRHPTIGLASFTGRDVV